MTKEEKNLQNTEEEESVVLSPDEVKARRERRRAEVNEKEQEVEVQNRAGKVAISYESNGRFDCPPVLYFGDYTTEHVSDLAMSSEDSLFETLVSIVNDLMNEDAEYDVQNMTLEEFMETLVAIKLHFSGKDHSHPWICECQYSVDDNERVINETMIDLSSLNYKSISAADENLRDLMKAKFDNISDKEFKAYLEKRYGGAAPEPNWSREQELKNIFVKEPFIYHDRNTGKVYEFRLMRLRDILKAKRIVREKYNPQIAQIQSKKAPAGSPMAQAKQQKKKEIEYLQKQKGKDSILYAKGLSLLKVDGQEITDPDEAIDIYKQLTQRNLFDISAFLSYVEFGINHDIDLECPICGKVSRRSLQQELNPIELLPMDNDSKNNKGADTRIDIFVGV